MNHFSTFVHHQLRITQIERLVSLLQRNDFLTRYNKTQFLEFKEELGQGKSDPSRKAWNSVFVLLTTLISA